MNSRPLLLLDVDGPLNPYAAGRNWLDKTDYRKREHTVGLRSYRVWLRRQHGAQLLTLAEETGVELVWATTWQHSANEHIGPRLRLPELPVIEFPTKFNGTTILGLRWKFGPVLTYAGDRPLAWFDDDFVRYHEDRDWFLDQRGDIPTLLHDVDPHVGLVDSDFDSIREWVATLPVQREA
jgi:hypothetical protein